MREKHTYGKRQGVHKNKEDINLDKVFGITNNGCDSKQIENFIKRTTGLKYFKGEIK